MDGRGEKSERTDGRTNRHASKHKSPSINRGTKYDEGKKVGVMVVEEEDDKSFAEFVL